MMSQYVLINKQSVWYSFIVWKVLTESIVFLSLNLSLLIFESFYLLVHSQVLILEVLQLLDGVRVILSFGDMAKATSRNNKGCTHVCWPRPLAIVLTLPYLLSSAVVNSLELVRLNHSFGSNGGKLLNVRQWLPAATKSVWEKNPVFEFWEISYPQSRRFIMTAVFMCVLL